MATDHWGAYLLVSSGLAGDSEILREERKGCRDVVGGLLSVGKIAILEQLTHGNHTTGMEDGETREYV